MLKRAVAFEKENSMNGNEIIDNFLYILGHFSVSNIFRYLTRKAIVASVDLRTMRFCLLSMKK